MGMNGTTGTRPPLRWLNPVNVCILSVIVIAAFLVYKSNRHADADTPVESPEPPPRIVRTFGPECTTAIFTDTKTGREYLVVESFGTNGFSGIAIIEIKPRE